MSLIRDIPPPSLLHSRVHNLVPAGDQALREQQERDYEQAMATLRKTDSGRDIADFLDSGQVDIKFWDDDEYGKMYPGSGASYDTMRDQMNLPGSALYPAAHAATTLVHEGQHAYDDFHGQNPFVQSLKTVAGSSVDGAKAAARFDNPLTAWVDSITGRQNEWEVRAYRKQAEVAKELGLNQSSWSLGQAKDGSVLSEQETRVLIAQTALYRLPPSRRLFLASTLGAGVTLATGIGIRGIAGKLAPGSYMAKHAWPVYVAGAALTGALTLNDQLHARALEKADPR